VGVRAAAPVPRSRSRRVAGGATVRSSPRTRDPQPFSSILSYTAPALETLNSASWTTARCERGCGARVLVLARPLVGEAAPVGAGQADRGSSRAPFQGMDAGPSGFLPDRSRRRSVQTTNGSANPRALPRPRDANLVGRNGEKQASLITKRVVCCCRTPTGQRAAPVRRCVAPIAASPDITYKEPQACAQPAAIQSGPRVSTAGIGG
jgi:hypothetical protein